MKKLMIAACAVALAGAVQAASTLTWESGQFNALPACINETLYPGEGYTGAGDWENGCIKALVWEFATDQSELYGSAEKIWAAYQNGGLKDEDAVDGGVISDPLNLNGQVNIVGSDRGADKTPVYAAILYLHQEETTEFDDVDFYMANYASGIATEMGNSLSNLGNTWGGIDGGAATVWSPAAAIPEPTSGLLLLLGVAGLALRRRRA